MKAGSQSCYNLVMKPQEPSQNPPADQPVAYDVNGRPLYTRPQPAAPTPDQGFYHVGRAVEPEQQAISPEVQARHDASVKKYPNLNLSKSEYVINMIRRHPIGLLIPVAVSAFLILLAIAVMIGYPAFLETKTNVAAYPPYSKVILICLLFAILFALGGYVTSWVYINNRFFLTNESVIQEIQTSLFAKREQTVSLANIEDASYRQSGIIQAILDYGTIRLSTEGDETTYRFYYVANPKKQIATLNNAVEAFKNGRPVEG